MEKTRDTFESHTNDEATRDYIEFEEEILAEQEAFMRGFGRVGLGGTPVKHVLDIELVYGD